MTRALCLLLGLWLLPCLNWPAAVWAQGQVDRGPGYLDLDSLGFRPGVAAAVDLSIGADQLAQAVVAARYADPDLAALLSSVVACRVVQYSQPDEQTSAAAGALVERLGQNGWQTVRVETQGTRQVSVLARMEAGVIAGLAVIANDPGAEVSIANVIGDLSPDHLARLGLPVPQ